MAGNFNSDIYLRFKYQTCIPILVIKITYSSFIRKCNLWNILRSKIDTVFTTTTLCTWPSYLFSKSQHSTRQPFENSMHFSLAPMCPERHLDAAELLGSEVRNPKKADAGKITADVMRRYMDEVINTYLGKSLLKTFVSACPSGMFLSHLSISYTAVAPYLHLITK